MTAITSRSVVGLLTAATLVFLSTPASAINGTTGPVGGIQEPTGGITSNYKTPPMKDSDTIAVPILFHGVQPITINWAGAMMQVHILDNTEVDVDFISDPTGLGFVPDPFGPRSNNVQSSPQMFTWWHPNAQGSGIVLPQSQIIPAFTIGLHAKNTTVLNNSDVDVTLGFWNIYHLPPGPGSSFLQLNPSDYVYGTEFFNPLAQGTFFEFPPFPIPPGAGMWYHVTEPMPPIHVPGGEGSFFYATFANTAIIGMEHIPEPTSIVMLALGGVCAFKGWRAWHRRVA